MAVREANLPLVLHFMVGHETSHDLLQGQSAQVTKIYVGVANRICMFGPSVDRGVAMLIPHSNPEDDTKAAHCEALQTINLRLVNYCTFQVIQEGSKDDSDDDD